MSDVLLNYKDFLVNGNISGTRESDIINYTFSSSSGDEIKDNGLYYDAKNGRWFKNFYYSSNSDGTTFYLPVLMEVTQDGDTYNFKSAALVRQRSADEYYSKVGKACGLDFWERGYEVLKNALKDDIDSVRDVDVTYNADGNIDGFNVTEYIGFSDGILYPNPDIIDYIYDMFNSEFGDVSRNYELSERDFSEDGTYLVTENIDIPDTMSALNQDELIVYQGLSSDQINTLVKEVMASDNPQVQNVFNHDFVRTMARISGTGGYYMHFVGYDVLNGVMTFTSGSGGMTTTNADYVEILIYPNEPWSISRVGNWGGMYDIPVYTEPTNGSYTVAGYPSGSGQVFFATAYDLIASNGSKKPYDLIPNYVYPSPTNLPIRVSDEPDEDEPTPDQDYWEIGTPTPKPIKIKVPIGVIPPIPHDIPSEDTVPDVSEVQSTKGLTHVYNPTDGEDGELEQFSAYLWDDSILTHLSQIWKNNPMDGIISAHELYFSPSVTSKQPIVLGNLTTPVSADVCTDRYQQLNCGYKYISRFWNDARDYQSKVSVYLPFIGFRDLDINDVLDSNVYIDYQIDIVTGDCTATISLQRKNASGNFIVTDGKPDKKVLYAFDGNCSVPIALSGADRNSMYSGVVGGAVGVVGGIASAFTGNVMGGISGVASGLSSVLGAKPSIEKSGNLGGNRGAMAFKKPYIIITRPIPNEPSKRAELLGKPTNKSVRLKDIKGYAKFKTVHVDTIGYASDSERDLIETMLLNGVIL